MLISVSFYREERAGRSVPLQQQQETVKSWCRNITVMKRWSIHSRRRPADSLRASCLYWTVSWQINADGLFLFRSTQSTINSQLVPLVHGYLCSIWGKTMSLATSTPETWKLTNSVYLLQSLVKFECLKHWVSSLCNNTADVNFLTRYAAMA